MVVVSVQDGADAIWGKCTEKGARYTRVVALLLLLWFANEERDLVEPLARLGS